jgi:hypothetical protein
MSDRQKEWLAWKERRQTRGHQDRDALEGDVSPLAPGAALIGSAPIKDLPTYVQS